MKRKMAMTTTTTEAIDATTGNRNVFFSFLRHELMLHRSPFPSVLHKYTSGNEDVSSLKIVALSDQNDIYLIKSYFNTSPSFFLSRRA